jgi:6-phosphogluconolactonase
MSARKKLAGAVALGFACLLSGCSGFFPPLATTTSGTGTSDAGDFVYVANATAQSVAAFTVGTGTLTAISGSPYALPLVPTAMTIMPTDTFLYIAGIGGIYGFGINSSTGVLSALSSGSALAITTLGSVSLDVSPDGQWLFALSQDGATLTEYQINATTGALSVFASANYVGAGGVQAVPKMVKVAPSGGYVFLALGTGGDIVYPFNTTTGALNTTSFQSLAASSATTGDNALTVDSTTSFLYIARSGGSSGVAVYGIGTAGALSPVTGSPFAAGNGPFSVTIDSTGKYVYAGNRTDGTISGFTIGTGGVLTALAGSPFASGAGVTSLARDNSGNYVLAASAGGSPDLELYSFSTATAGALVSAATAATGTDPTSPVMVVATH